MPTEKKQIAKLVIKGAYSLFISAGVLAVVILVTFFYNENHKPLRFEQKTAKLMEFPENPQMLEEMSEKLAQEGAILSEIATAAGGEEDIFSDVAVEVIETAIDSEDQASK